ncbi:hypothetical protein ZWY2020_018682 [Hordeum vulgare]|nr:hypothetical protein ZWY2020_018682 [Hordeum vulgare]
MLEDLVRLWRFAWREKKFPSRDTTLRLHPHPARSPSPSVNGASGRRHLANPNHGQTVLRRGGAIRQRPLAKHFPGPASSYASGSAQQLFYPGAPTCSSANTSTPPPHLYPPLMETSSPNPTW